MPLWKNPKMYLNIKITLKQLCILVMVVRCLHFIKTVCMQNEWVNSMFWLAGNNINLLLTFRTMLIPVSCLQSLYKSKQGELCFILDQDKASDSIWKLPEDLLCKV